MSPFSIKHNLVRRGLGLRAALAALILTACFAIRLGAQDPPPPRGPAEGVGDMPTVNAEETTATQPSSTPEDWADERPEMRPDEPNAPSPPGTIPPPRHGRPFTGMGGMRMGGMGGMRGMDGGIPGRGRPRWNEADRRLQECRQRFDQLEARREELLNELAAARQRFKPGQMDPASVLANKSIDRILGQLHGLVEESRENTEEAGRALGGALLSRRLWEPALRRDLTAGGLNPQERARKTLWLAAAARLDKEGREGFAKALLGDTFGPLALEAMPEEFDRLAPLPGPPPPGLRRGAGPPTMRELGDLARQRWLARLDRIERHQEELTRILQRQEREIQRLRQLLGADTQPPPPDQAKTPPPGRTAPAAPSGY